MNFFKIFGLPVSYDLDEAALDKAYFEKLRGVHPDAAVVGDAAGEDTADVTDNADAADVVSSSDLNVAYHTLINPIDRAEHFLEVHGVQPLRDQLPMDFAEEIFELRQRYDSIGEDREKKDFIGALKRRMVGIEDYLKRAAEKSDISSFRSHTGLLRFLNSFLEKIDSDAYSRD